MSSKIVGWLVGAQDGKILKLKKKSGIIKKKSGINQEMVNTVFLPFCWVIFDKNLGREKKKQNLSQSADSLLYPFLWSMLT